MSDETPLIIGDAVVAELGRPSRRRWFRGKKQPPPPLVHCENCGAELIGPYCAKCGQPAIDYRRSLGSLMVDAADAFFNFDARFFQSFGLLLIKPWRLTNEFVEGKRARHVHPLRVYLIASVTFFLVINLLSRNAHLHQGRNDDQLDLALGSDKVARGSPSPAPTIWFGLPTPESPGTPEVQVPLAPAPSASSSPSGKRDFFTDIDNAEDEPPVAKWFARRAKEKIGPTGDKSDLFLKTLIQNLAPMVLCCIPLFAL